ncbi:MAG: metal-sulfur cluster assembly factor [Bradymonadales bacterium]|nr:MAG: metal-sulfur cluster assembly factor [Bradymonadales bacterium]
MTEEPKQQTAPFNKDSVTSEFLEWLKPVQDPELHMSLVDLGLVYSVKDQGDGVFQVEITLTSPGCPAGDYLVEQIRGRMLEHERVQAAEVKVVWEPQWNPVEMASEEAKEALGLW